ncbi:MAG: hypothetical protein DRO11_10170 [Methanobacteriota archaeon]|nr:MAG: hypothetical protein DRO11_10170 [Euryarchaeota archaeon]
MEFPLQVYAPCPPLLAFVKVLPQRGGPSRKRIALVLSFFLGFLVGAGKTRKKIYLFLSRKGSSPRLQWILARISVKESGSLSISGYSILPMEIGKM